MSKNIFSVRYIFLIGYLIVLISFGNISYAFIASDIVSGSNPEVLTATNDESIQETKEIAPKYVPGEVLVKFKEGTNPSSILKEAGIEIKGIERVHSIKSTIAKFKKDYKLEKDPAGSWYSFLGKQYKEIADIPDEEMFKEAYNKMPETEKALYRSYKVELPEGISVEETVSKLKNNPNVEFAEPNGIARALEYPETLPNDTYINKSRDGITWSKGAWTQTYEDMWGLKKIQANTAWPTSRGDGVVVAVIDSGVDNHSDISGNIWINDDEVPGDGIDNDGNGYIDDCRAWNFLNNNNATIDNFGHGTHVAGTIAALANNGRGIAGVAPQAKIMPIVGLGSLGGSYDTLAACVRYAAENGAHILNCSWGGQLDSQTLKDAFIVAHSRNCVCVAAAGNSSADAMSLTPANINSVITVAASSLNDSWCNFSNYGTKIDVAAPGGGNYDSADPNSYYRNILSLRAGRTDMYEDGKSVVATYYYRSRGTSMACPHVAGLAALIKAKHLDYNPEEIRQVIRISSDDIISAGWDRYSGYGRINCARALTIESPCTAQISSPVFGQVVSDRVEVIGTITGSLFGSYTLEYKSAGDLDSVPWTVLETQYTLRENETLGYFDTLLAPNSVGEYLIRIKVTDTAGRSFYSNIVRVRVINGGIENIPTNEIYRSGNVIEVIGTVNARDMSYYYLEYRKGLAAWSSQGITLENGGTLPVTSSRLGWWDTSGLPEGSYSLRLSITRTTGVMNRVEKYLTITPYLKEGFPIRIEFNTPADAPYRNMLRTFFVVSDLDMDGSEEIIVLVSGNPARVAVYKSNGALFPGWPIEIPVAGFDIVLVCAQQRPMCVDLNGDGQKEILVSIYEYVAGSSPGYMYAQQRYIYAYNSDGTPCQAWNANFSSQVKANNIDDILVSADLNKDGYSEVILCGTQPNGPHQPSDEKALIVTDYLGNVISAIPKGVLGEYWSQGEYFSSLAIGNLDSDSDLEILLADPRHSSGQYGTSLRQYVTALNMDGSAVSSNWPLILTNNGRYSYGGNATLADVDGDQKDEVLVSRGEHVYGFITLDENEVGINLQSISEDKTYSEHIRTVDWTGNGNLQIAAVDKNGYLRIFNLNGTLDPAKPVIFVGQMTYDPNLLDINGDNVLDVLAWRSGVISAFDGITGQRISSLPSLYPNYIYPSYNNGYCDRSYMDMLTSIDIDKDGKLELVGLGELDFFANAAETNSMNHVNVLVWDTGFTVNPARMEWTMLNHDSQNTNRYNRPPKINAINDPITVNINELINFEVTCEDVDPVRLFCRNLPQGAVFENRQNNTAVFSWRPTYEQVGIYDVTFTVSDGIFTDKETIAITVKDVNRLPDISGIPSSLTKNEGDTITKVEIELATDPDGDILTYTYSGWTTSLPYTIGYDQSGNHTLHVEASDGKATIGKDITITVNNVNRPPLLDPIGNQATNENQQLQFTISAVDLDNDPLIYSANNLPQDAVFNPETRTFTWTPTYKQAGNYTVAFIASDGSLSDEESIVIKVNNVPIPDLTTGAITYTVAKNGLYTFRAPISNIGDKAIRTPFYVYFYVDGVRKGSRHINRLAAGRAVVTSFSWTGVKGSHTVKIAADATGRIRESDENNNSAQIKIVVK